MKVKELIEKLQVFDGDSEVVAQVNEFVCYSELTSGHEDVEKVIDTVIDLESRIVITLEPTI